MAALGDVVIYHDAEDPPVDMPAMVTELYMDPDTLMVDPDRVYLFIMNRWGAGSLTGDKIQGTGPDQWSPKS